MVTRGVRMLVGLGLAVVMAGAIATTVRTQIPARDTQLPVMPPYADVRSIEQDALAIREFDRRVTQYVTLHRLLEGPLPTLQVSTDMRVVRAAMDALAASIQTARKNARQGEVLTPEVSRVFRKRIAASLTPEEWEEILSEQDEDPVPVPPLGVNARWPGAMPFNLVPPRLIAALPPLPEELQYRIIGRSLVLWDHHADLVVDFLPGAFTS